MKYDELLKKLKVVRKDEKGRIIWVYNVKDDTEEWYEYDDKDNVIHRKIENSKTSTPRYTTLEYVVPPKYYEDYYKFDDYGNCIYHKRGNFTENIDFDKDGNPIRYYSDNERIAFCYYNDKYDHLAIIEFSNVVNGKSDGLYGINFYDKYEFGKSLKYIKKYRYNQPDGSINWVLKYTSGGKTEYTQLPNGECINYVTTPPNQESEFLTINT